MTHKLQVKKSYQAFQKLFSWLPECTKDDIFPKTLKTSLETQFTFKPQTQLSFDINMNVLETKSSLNFNNINQEKKHNFTEKDLTKENNQNKNLEKKQSKVESCCCIAM